MKISLKKAKAKVGQLLGNFRSASQSHALSPSHLEAGTAPLVAQQSDTSEEQETRTSQVIVAQSTALNQLAQIVTAPPPLCPDIDLTSQTPFKSLEVSHIASEASSQRLSAAARVASRELPSLPPVRAT